MIKDVVGDLIKDTDPLDLIIIPVNTIGVAGKGLAAWMKFNLPLSHEYYKKQCRKGAIDQRELKVTNLDGRLIALFPTKHNWRNSAIPSLIKSSLIRLRTYMFTNNILSAHMPLIGCGVGTGGLDYNTVVRPLILEIFENTPLTIYVYHQGS